VGLKILGDANVPAGQITFRFFLSSVADAESKITAANPVDLGHWATPRLAPDPEAIHKHGGLGTIAGHGFENPQVMRSTLFVRGPRSFAIDFVNFVSFTPFSCSAFGCTTSTSSTAR